MLGIWLPWNVLSCCSHSLPCRLLLGEVVLLKDIFPLESLESAPRVGRHMVPEWVCSNPVPWKTAERATGV